MQAGESLKRDQQAGTGSSTSTDCNSEAWRHGRTLFVLFVSRSAEGLRIGDVPECKQAVDMQDKTTMKWITAGGSGTFKDRQAYIKEEDSLLYNVGVKKSRWTDSREVGGDELRIFENVRSGKGPLFQLIRPLPGRQELVMSTSPGKARFLTTGDPAALPCPVVADVPAVLVLAARLVGVQVLRVGTLPEVQHASVCVIKSLIAREMGSPSWWATRAG